MDETYGTSVDDEYVDNHDYDDDTIPKASFKRINDLGTSPGHEPIIDQSCGAVLFIPCRLHRDLPDGGLPVPVRWI